MQQTQTLDTAQPLMQVPPAVITTKDSLYLKDELSWELLAMKKCSHNARECSDPEIRQAIDKAGLMHQQHYTRILKFLQTNNNQATSSMPQLQS